ncbi:hypothetical protein AU468_05960 [Alkalispirochaeta sphaeroplastigenens]|uniref:Bacterial transcription activator effector binding domain-containing protein n=1 Tax=Alkalispirochaeta sphaeroplastigenens TaxID=1187066 RepID=A0A2S4JU97_9SPIO|nr:MULTISPECIES: GyrI-like domain-containing protein [Alkalispirochaeta]POR03094.1 hypothetical protein AU468_05960 [Alkalispirochaeta sphaeroplastigenens]
MQVTIHTFPPVCLAGASFFGNPFTSHAAWTEENEIGLLWQRYLSLLREQSPPSRENDPPGEAFKEEFFELHILHPGSNLRGEYEVFAGHPVQFSEIARWPLPFSLKVIPPGEYGLFWLNGPDAAEDWAAELELPEGYRLNTSFSVLRYDHRFRGMDQLEESQVQIHAPLLRH